MCTETVTITLETFKEMEGEILSLKKQLKEKTIIETIEPTIYGVIWRIGIFALMVSAMAFVGMHH